MTDHNKLKYSKLPDLIDDLKLHDHLCLIYESREEWLETVVPYILSGLERGEKCIYIVDANTAREVKTIFKEEGLAVDEYESKGQLSIVHERDTYTRGGFFDPDLIIAFLIEETQKAVREGYSGLRVTGEMSWVLRGYRGAERVLEYEAKLNKDLFPAYPCMAICQYDRWKFDPETIKGVVLTHPLLIRGGQIYHNFYYVEPEEYLNHKKGAREVQHWLNNLERERKIQESLRESEEKYRRLYETMTQGVIYQDADGKIISANPAAERILGLTFDQMQGKTSIDPHWKMIQEDGTPVPGNDHPTMIALRTGHQVGPVVRGIYRPDLNNYIWLNITAIPLYQPGNTGPFQAYATFEDITARKQAEEALRYHYKFEKMVSEIALYFINLSADQVDEGIHHALKECGEFFQVERSYIFLLSPDGQSVSMTHEWNQREAEPQINRLQEIPTAKRPWWYDQAIEKGYVHIPDVNNLPGEAEAERNEFRKQNIKSLLCIPMISGGKIIGHLGLDAIKEKKTWSEEQINLLKVLAELISNALERRWSDEKIRTLSLCDQLTGLYNRYFLEEEMKRLDTARQLPLSIIMADLNGLKLINDTYGHAKGDEMLKCAAGILKKSCRKEDIIARWGGDEFVILLPQTGEEEATRIKSRITERCHDAYFNDMPVSIALGFSVKKNVDEELSLVLQEAEDNMYKQKLIESQSTKGGLLKTLRKTLEEKSFETEEHTRNMQEIASKIAEKINLPDSEINRLRLLITLHDIGKINIDEKILTKTEPLTPEEWELIKKHPETGCRIALAAEDFAHVAKNILAHHEHWDGSGYPHGLKGEEIPLLSRITAIADAYEVMSRGRPYKKALTTEEIKAEFKRCAGTQFDPDLVEVFLSIMEE